MAGDVLYSKIAVAEVFSIVVLAIVIYGFEIDGVKKIIDAYASKMDLSGVFNQIFFSRLMLMLCSLAVLPFVYWIYGTETFNLTLFWMLIPLSYVVQNSYFFLALEQNFTLAIVNIISRVSSILIVILCVQNSVDAFYAPAYIGGCYFVGACITFFILIKSFKVKVNIISLATCFSTLRNSFHVFISNISVLLYRDLNVIFLSMITHDASAIANYSIAEKFVKSYQAIFRPISQFFFPKVVVSLKNFSAPEKASFWIIIKTVRIQIALFVFSLITLAAGYYFLMFFLPMFNEIVIRYHSILPLFLIMTGAIFFGIPNFMLGSVGLNVLKRKHKFAMYVLITGLLNIIVCSALSELFGAVGAAISFVFAEFLLLSLVSFTYFRGRDDSRV